MSARSDLLDAALACAARHWLVLPCKPRGKEPLTPHGFRDATTDEAAIRNWWGKHPTSNIGVATGNVSKIAVLDVDGAEGEISLKLLPLLPSTFTVRTGRGRHLYFKCTEPLRSARLGPGLDFKGEGGYVLAAPSIHPNGTRYEVIDGREPARLPEELLQLLTAQIRSSGDVRPDEVGKIPEGQRNQTLARLAGTMRRPGMTGEAIEAALVTENALRCDPPLLEAEVRKVARSVSRYAPEPARPGAEPAPNGSLKKSRATQLVELTKGAKLFHSPDRTPYATAPVAGHFETWPVQSVAFRQWLAHMYYREHEAAPNSQSLRDAIDVIAAGAQFDGPEEPVFVRVGESDKKIYLDLCDDRWRVCEISAHGYVILERSPVNFRRASGVLPLPVPVPGVSLSELGQYVNLRSDEDLTLLLACLVAALRPRGPYPILVIEGEHGAGKSTLARIFRSLVDPYKAPVRSAPREEADLLIAAGCSHVVALDNLSKLDSWLSDALCRLATGGGVAKRQLYTDLDQVILDVQRPVVINSIEELPTRGDFLDRSVILRLPPIGDDGRQEEAPLWAKFEQARAQLLGALLNAVSTALRDLDSVHLDRKPRMADFAVWAVAAEPAFGLHQPIFLSAYDANRAGGNSAALEASMVATPLIQFMGENDSWTGGMKDLLQKLTSLIGQDEGRNKYWPRSARGLRAALDRIGPNLRGVGLRVTYPATADPATRRHSVKIEKLANNVSDVSNVSSSGSMSKHLRHLSPLLSIEDESHVTDGNPQQNPVNVEKEAEWEA